MITAKTHLSAFQLFNLLLYLYLKSEQITKIYSYSSQLKNLGFIGEKKYIGLNARYNFF